MTLRVSIITISFNSEKTIQSTLESVLNQKYENIEYIIVDGGSLDNTNQIINKYIPKFIAKGIDVNYKSEHDNGISDAFNKGISRSTGDIIGIINSDDCLSKNALEVITAAFEDGIDVVCGDCFWIDEVHSLKYIRKSRLKLNKLKYDMVLMHPTCFVKKTAYEKYGVFDTTLKYVMDKDLMARFYKKGARFKYVPVVISTMSAGGVSDVYRKRVYEEGILVAERNGVPRWKAEMRTKYKSFRAHIINLLKQNRFIWKRVRN